MLLLTGTGDLVQVTTSTANALHVQASYMDNNAGAITPGRLNNVIAAAATTSVVASPGASTQRNVKYLGFVAVGGANVVTVKHTDGTTVPQIFSVSLTTGMMLVFTDLAGWQVFNAAGQLLTSGAAGGTPAVLLGAAAAAGVSPLFLRIDDTIVANRAALPADARGWTFLGTATGATVTVGPIVWTGTWQQLMIKYFIAGYNGGTPVGRALLGAASISTTALTNSFSLSEGVTAPTTGLGATAIPGCPLAVTLSAIGRGGTIMVDGASGAVKSLEIIGRNVTPSVASAPTLFRGASFFSDLGTNLPLLRAQLSVYDTLTAVALSAQTFTAGTYLTVWGRNND